MSRSSDSRTRDLAIFATEMPAGEIPHGVLEHAKCCLLDTLGCGIYGSALPWTRTLREVMLGLHGSKYGSVAWGTAHRFPADICALVNGTAVHSFELDDLHKKAILHPGGTCIPAVTAVLQDRKRQVSGEEYLAAIVIGYEVAVRVGLAIGLKLLQRGWHNNGVLGALASAVGAGRILQLNPVGMDECIGIGATQASGLMSAQYGSMAKRMHAGSAAQAGVYAALLTAGGFRGISGVLDTGYGRFIDTFVGGAECDELTSDLGSVWHTKEVGFKRYAACGSSHTAIDAALAIRPSLGARKVGRVEIRASSVTKDHVGWAYVPDSTTTAQMNLSYAVACALLYGEVFVDQFKDEVLVDSKVIELAGRIIVKADAGIDRRGRDYRHEVYVDVITESGERFSRHVEHASGSERFPLSEEELVQKFRRLAEPVIGAERAAEVQQCVERAEQLEDARMLAELLSVPAGRSSSRDDVQ